LPRKRAAFLGRTVVKNDQFVALPLPYLLWFVFHIPHSPCSIIRHSERKTCYFAPTWSPWKSHSQWMHIYPQLFLKLLFNVPQFHNQSLKNPFKWFGTCFRGRRSSRGGWLPHFRVEK
jgi:hypothetical protein